MDRRLEFGLLGPLEMSVDGALVALGTPKQRAVLAMLLMNRNNPVGVDRLIAALWEGSPPSGARASIHSYVSNLRKLLSGFGIDSRVVLAAAPPGYRLTIPENACDLGRFIAEKTARNHVERVYAKLGVKNRTQASLAAIDRGVALFPTDAAAGT